MPRPGTRAVVVVVGLLLATLVAVTAIVLVVGVPFGPGRSDLERAVAGAPAGTERASWTDWDGVRAATRVARTRPTTATTTALVPGLGTTPPHGLRVV